MQFRNWGWVLLLLASACETPEAKLNRLQRQFLNEFGRQDFFEIKTKNEAIRLPLPPTAQQSEAQKMLANELRIGTYAIEYDQLPPAEQKRFTQFCAALDQFCSDQGEMNFDPAQCVVTDRLQQLVQRGDFDLLLLFLEKMPAYYSELEGRWRAPDTMLAAQAMEKSLDTLDLLDELEMKSGEKLRAKIPAARGAVKDFIGMCWSASLR